MGKSAALAHLDLISLILIAIPTVHAGFWSISIDESPAPLPQDGPPFSAHASRNRALLPAQICGIAGAYLGSIFLVGFLLLTVGRRFRTTAQSSQSTLAMEMVKPANKAFGTSPISPSPTQRSWYSPRRYRHKSRSPNSLRSTSNPGSPGMESLSSFDAKVLETDKAARQEEMERLYAAVMARDDPGPAESSAPAVAEAHTSSQVRPTSERRPLRLLTTAPGLQHLQNEHMQLTPTSPTTPRSPIRAIYPPDSPRSRLPVSPISPFRADYAQPAIQHQHTEGTSNYRMSSSPPGTNNRTSRASSFASDASGGGTRPKRLRKSLRKLRISAPIPRYPGEEESDSARTPLSPRYYADPGIPPSPPGNGSGATPELYDRFRTATVRHSGGIDQIRDLPHPAPQRRSSFEHGGQVHETGRVKNETAPRTILMSTNATPWTASNAAGVAIMPVHDPSTNISDATRGTLPFRSMQTSQTSEPLQSPGRTFKTTFLERRRDTLGTNGLRSGLATPYSPYMPFTPVTPVTPHLTSRRERKQKEREEGRRVLNERDAVIDEEEMWGTAY